MNLRLVNHVAKMKRLLRGELGDSIMINFLRHPKHKVMDHFPDHKKMFEYEVENIRDQLQYRDDFFPSLAPDFGAPFGAFLGGELNFNVTTGLTWSRPVPDVYARLDTICYNESYPWLAKWIEAMRYYREHAPEDIILNCSSTWGPMDIAEILRGPDIYLDFYDRPDEVRQLLNRCGEFVYRFHQTNKVFAHQVEGGFFGWQSFWMPGNHFAVTDDVSTNYSVQTFETFTRPIIENVTARTGGYFWFHLEGSAIHILDSLAQMKGLTLLQYTNNPKWKRGMDMVDTLKSKLNRVPLKILLTRQELIEGMQQRLLPGNCIYDVGIDAEHLDDYVQTPEEANDIMRRVAEYRPKY